MYSGSLEDGCFCTIGGSSVCSHNSNLSMSVVTGYSTDSESENDVEIEETTDSIVPYLPHASADASVKTTSGKFQQEYIEPLQFKRNKRIHSAYLADDGASNKMNKSKVFMAMKATKDKAIRLKRKKSKGDPSILDDEEERKGYKGSWASSSSLSDDDEYDEVVEVPENESFVVKASDTIEQSEPDYEFKESSKYYGKRSDNSSIYDLPKDYQIRFATTVAGQKEYFTPKKLLSSFKAHESAVTSLEFFPHSGHMLLSAGNDCMIKLWSTTKPKSLIRDYHSHSKPVKHVTFSESGHEFISCSYDRTVKIWDTERGEVEYKHKVSSNPNMATFVPNKPNEYMAALDSRRVEHFDWRTKDSIQTYEHHQSAITWIEFINGGNQFITASDDRTLKIWDIRVNMPIKYIQDPKQQAMPIVKKHPNGQYFVGQSMDNQILVYSTKQQDKFKKNSNKFFSGHKSAAYAIQMGFTPDGKTLISGDSNGYCYFWDWKSTKVIRRLKVSEKVISCVDVHPLETSLVSMAGFDGNIYLYT